LPSCGCFTRVNDAGSRAPFGLRRNCNQQKLVGVLEEGARRRPDRPSSSYHHSRARIFWVDLNAFDLSQKSGKVMKLDLGPSQTHIYSEMANDQFKVSPPFKLSDFEMIYLPRDWPF
jgi:hypothetical protein